MTTAPLNMENSRTKARSVLDCASALALWKPHHHRKSARELAHSKPCRPRLVHFCFLLSALCFPALGQYSIDWSTVDGGGGTSTGGVYAVSGTIGQPDAGAMSGGGYTLNGGFWGVVAAVQTPGAPWLTITRTLTNSVVVSWPLPADGWVLEWTNRVAGVSAAWPQISPPYQTNATQAWIVEPAPTGTRFYRLHKP